MGQIQSPLSTLVHRQVVYTVMMPFFLPSRDRNSSSSSAFVYGQIPARLVTFPPTLSFTLSSSNRAASAAVTDSRAFCKQTYLHICGDTGLT